MKAVGRASLDMVRALCAQPRLLQLSLSRDAGSRVQKAPGSALDRGRSVNLLQNVWWLLWLLREQGDATVLSLPEPCEENPAGAGLGRCVFYFFFVSHIPRASPGEVSHDEDGMEREMGDL